MARTAITDVRFAKNFDRRSCFHLARFDTFFDLQFDENNDYITFYLRYFYLQIITYKILRKVCQKLTAKYFYGASYGL